MSLASKVIAQLNLQPLTEGGYYRRIYQSDNKDSQGRRYGAAIYYLLEGNDFSSFHRIDCDELWHFYAGDPLLLYQINPAGELNKTQLGNPLSNESNQSIAIIQKGNWMAAELMNKTGFSLIGCTTTPEFKFESYELADAKKLSTQFPQHRDIIMRLTR